MSEGLGTPSNGGRGIGQRLRWPLLIGGPVIVIAVVGYFVLTGGRYQTTDDAYVEAARAPISANVSARVVELAVHDNQPVKKGQLLFRLDDRDFKAALAQAQAQLAAARLGVETQRATADQQTAAVTEAQAALDYAQRELARQKVLVGGGVASQQQLDQAKNAVDEARAHLQAVQEQAIAARVSAGADKSPVDSHPAVLQALAMLQKAQLNESYTTVTAPQDGVVTKVEQIQVGSYITGSQPLFWLVSGRPYIEANFKENQLAKMRVGQTVDIDIDAYPGRKLTGTLASFSPGAGSTFSVLPAQNSTGNWVKVVQRLPVRIEFNQVPPDAASHAGLSANVKVDTGARGS